MNALTNQLAASQLTINQTSQPPTSLQPDQPSTNQTNLPASKASANLQLPAVWHHPFLSPAAHRCPAWRSSLTAESPSPPLASPWLSAGRSTPWSTSEEQQQHQLSRHLHHSLLHGHLQGVVLLGQHLRNNNNISWVAISTTRFSMAICRV